MNVGVLALFHRPCLRVTSAPRYQNRRGQRGALHLERDSEGQRDGAERDDRVEPSEAASIAATTRAQS